MSNRRDLGVVVMVVGVLLYVVLGVSQIAFDYPVLLLLAGAAVIAGIALILVGGRRSGGTG